MAYIRVNCASIDSAIKAVDSYIDLMKKKMVQANVEIDTLSSNWEGADYTAFQSQWDKVTNGSSTYAQMLQALESYSAFLKDASSRYKKAQSDAKNRAYSLPKY